MTSAAPLSVVHGLFPQTSRIALKLHHGTVINCNSGSEQISLGGEGSDHLLLGLPERSVQRVADPWHGSPVQVNGRAMCGLRCESQLGYPDTQATTARGKFGPLRCQLRDISACLSPFPRRRCSGAIANGGTSLKS